MATNSSIEWTDHTFNPWWGCMKVSEGCKNCYAETLDNRWHHDNAHWGPGSSRKPMSEKYWQQPFEWDAAAQAAGVKAKVFCASMADVFEDNEEVEFWRARLFTTIDCTPNLVWQLLTKRPENILPLSSVWNRLGWPDNVWIGTTVENQESADNRIPVLLEVPAKVRFLSCEPLLERIDLNSIWVECPKCEGSMSVPVEGGGAPCPRCIYPYQGVISGVDWVICGGESGHKARPMHPDWARSLRDECAAAGVPFFFKQWGEYLPACQSTPEQQNKPKQFPSPNNPEKMNTYYQNGKHLNGALLDGHEWKEMPR